MGSGIGDSRVLLWGDSLTEGKPGGSYARHLIEKMPEVNFLNRGKGGDTVSSLLKRLETEPLPPLKGRADVAVLWVGVNDIYADINPGNALWKTAMGQPPTRDAKVFAETFAAILDVLAHHTCRIIALPPLFLGENPSSEYNIKLLDLGNLIRSTAEANQMARFLDIKAVMPLSAVDPPRFLPVNPWAKLADTFAGGIEESYFDKAAERRGLKWTYDGVHLNGLGAETVAEVLAASLNEILSEESHG